MKRKKIYVAIFSYFHIFICCGLWIRVYLESHMVVIVEVMKDMVRLWVFIEIWYGCWNCCECYEGHGARLKQVGHEQVGHKQVGHKRRVHIKRRGYQQVGHKRVGYINELDINELDMNELDMKE
eukprot:837564_1